MAIDGALVIGGLRRPILARMGGPGAAAGPAVPPPAAGTPTAAPGPIPPPPAPLDVAAGGPSLTPRGAALLMLANEIVPLVIAMPVMVAVAYDAATGRPIPELLGYLATAIGATYFASRGAGALRLGGAR